MDIRKSRIFKARRRLLVHLLLCVATVALIVWFLPRETNFNYQYDLGKPWKYGQLMATFDFPIYKSDDVVKHEQDSLNRSFQPYYDLDEAVLGESQERMLQDWRDQKMEVVPSLGYVQHVTRLMREVYEVGLLSTEDMNRLKEDSVAGIMMVQDRMAVSCPVDELFSVKEAYSWILEADTLNYKTDILRRMNIDSYLEANLSYNQQRTQEARQELQDSYSLARGMVQSGEKIIDRGEIVEAKTYDILESLRKESSLRSESATQVRLMLLGQTLFTCVVIAILMVYLRLYRPEYLRRRNSLLLLLSFVAGFSVMHSLMVSNNLLVVYILPYAMFPLIIRTFLDSRTAFISFMLTVLICSVSLKYPHEFIILQLLMGMVAIYGLRELTQRSQIFIIALLVLLTYCVVFFAYELFTENDLGKMNRSMFIYLSVSSVLTLFTYPLLLVIEKVFGFTSNVTLIELSNTNSPLLRRLSVEAPGTFQHSMQVANLASEAAVAVGAKPQLVRTGAMYHDIGKLSNPGFFTENQTSGLNPHDRLDVEQSAAIVISHVTAGLELAREYGLPEAIRAFITTHHGLGKTKYFYITWKNQHPGQEPEAGMFDYVGPDPYTLEQAILMMADSVEAASRSLKEYSQESVEALVEKIIDAQVAEGHFLGTPITFKQIAIIKQVFKDRMRSVFHPRVSYPELRKG